MKHEESGGTKKTGDRGIIPLSPVFPDNQNQ
jgi:hypothetical protein